MPKKDEVTSTSYTLKGGCLLSGILNGPCLIFCKLLLLYIIVQMLDYCRGGFCCWSYVGPVTISSRPIWQRGSGGMGGDGSVVSDGPSAETSEVSSSILAMLYAQRNPDMTPHQNNSILSKDDGIVRYKMSFVLFSTEHCDNIIS